MGLEIGFRYLLKVFQLISSKGLGFQIHLSVSTAPFFSTLSQPIISIWKVFSRCVFTWEAGSPGDVEVEVFGGIDEHVQIPVLLVRCTNN